MWEKFRYSMNNKALVEVLLCKHLDNEFRRKIEGCLSAYYARWGTDDRSSSLPNGGQQQLNALQNSNDNQ